MTDSTLRYRWVVTGPLEFYRHAQAYDHIAAEIARKNPPACMVGKAAGMLESYRFGYC